MPTSDAAAYAEDLSYLLEHISAGKGTVYIPTRKDLHRRLPRTHFHPFPELLIQTGGASSLDCPGESFVMNTWDICVIPRGVPHAETPLDKDSPYALIACMQHRDGQYLHRGRANAMRQIEGYATVAILGVRPRDVFNYLDDATSHGEVSGARRDHYIRSLVEVFLITTLAELDELPNQKKPESKISALVIDAEQMVRSLLADPELRVAKVARALGYSADYLSRQFHRERGQSLLSWILHERITMACDLLRDHRYNIAEVGWACGFNEPSYFIRVFRNHRGMTPRIYRQSLG